MFSPTRDEARETFFRAWRAYRDGRPLAGVDALALEVILLHPEYHTLLDAPEAHVDRDYTPADGQLNPFLHLSLHLAVEEQLSIDQPTGIRRAYERLAARRASEHDARHELLECLGETVWEAQRTGGAPDEHAYLACIERKAAAKL